MSHEGTGRGGARNRCIQQSNMVEDLQELTEIDHATELGILEPQERNLQNGACLLEGRVHSLSDSPLDPLERLVRGKT